MAALPKLRKMALVLLLSSGLTYALPSKKPDIACSFPSRPYSFFHVTARAGSISRAAEELSVTPSAVSQQIQLLENQFGVTLLTKAGRGIALTEAGERYFSMISDQIERIEESTATIRGFRSVTTLTIRATPTLSNKWLLPRLGGLLDRYPDLEVRLRRTNEPTDFNQELVDLELRHGNGRWPGLFVEGLRRSVSCRSAHPPMRRRHRWLPKTFPPTG